MEDILDLYEQPFDESFPVICMDEKPIQLLKEARELIPMKTGRPARQDGEYIRNGTCSIFIFTEPLAGWRHVTACERRTKIDWANQIRDLLEVYYPDNFFDVWWKIMVLPVLFLNNIVMISPFL